MANNNWRHIDKIVRQYKAAQNVRINFERTNLRKAIRDEQKVSPIRFEPPKVRIEKTFQDRFVEIGGKDCIEALKKVIGG